jgi:NADH-quinone oxidoreductase subunit J
MSPDVILFLIFAFIAVLSAVSLVTQTHPIASALSLIGVMGALAVLYLLLGAEFMFAAQLIVYAGAIMVLFVFVIMLLNAGSERRISRSRLVKWFGIPIFALFLAVMAFFIQRFLPPTEPVVFGHFTNAGGQEIGRSLFTAYLLPFEVTSLLILVAILGAVVLARKEL